MTYKDLEKELIKTIKEKNREKKNVIADIITCAKNIAIAEKCKDNISDEIVLKAILKAKKTCQEQIDTCPSNRLDLLEIYKLNMNYIEEYTPKMMTKEEIKNTIDNILSSCDEKPTNKGEIMKIIMPMLRGKAEGKDINEVVNNNFNFVCNIKRKY